MTDSKVRPAAELAEDIEEILDAGYPLDTSDVVKAIEDDRAAVRAEASWDTGIRIIADVLRGLVGADDAVAEPIRKRLFATKRELEIARFGRCSND